MRGSLAKKSAPALGKFVALESGWPLAPGLRDVMRSLSSSHQIVSTSVLPGHVGVVLHNSEAGTGSLVVVSHSPSSPLSHAGPGAADELLAWVCREGPDALPTNLDANLAPWLAVPLANPGRGEVVLFSGPRGEVSAVLLDGGRVHGWDWDGQGWTHLGSNGRESDGDGRNLVVLGSPRMALWREEGVLYGGGVPSGRASVLGQAVGWGPVVELRRGLGDQDRVVGDGDGVWVLFADPQGHNGSALAYTGVSPDRVWTAEVAAEVVNGAPILFASFESASRTLILLTGDGSVYSCVPDEEEWVDGTRSVEVKLLFRVDAMEGGGFDPLAVRALFASRGKVGLLGADGASLFHARTGVYLGLVKYPLGTSLLDLKGVLSSPPARIDGVLRGCGDILLWGKGDLFLLRHGPVLDEISALAGAGGQETLSLELLEAAADSLGPWSLDRQSAKALLEAGFEALARAEQEEDDDLEVHGLLLRVADHLREYLQNPALLLALLPGSLGASQGASAVEAHVAASGTLDTYTPLNKLLHAHFLQYLEGCRTTGPGGVAPTASLAGTALAPHATRTPRPLPSDEELEGMPLSELRVWLDVAPRALLRPAVERTDLGDQARLDLVVPLCFEADPSVLVELCGTHETGCISVLNVLESSVGPTTMTEEQAEAWFALLEGGGRDVHERLEFCLARNDIERGLKLVGGVGEGADGYASLVVDLACHVMTSPDLYGYLGSVWPLFSEEMTVMDVLSVLQRALCKGGVELSVGDVLPLLMSRLSQRTSTSRVSGESE